MRWSEILLESVKKYQPMFGGIAPMIKPSQAEGFKVGIERTISEVERVLKREDRVVWMLRWQRFNTLRLFIDAGLVDTIDDPNAAPNTNQAKKLMGRYCHELGMSEEEATNQYKTWIAEQTSVWKHFVDLPAPKVQSFVWDRQSPQVLYAELQKLEKEWTDARKQEIKHDEGNDPELFLDFGNGWAWYDLQKHSCDVEASAMGHCGNSGGNWSDTILSLRKKVGDQLYRPSLTFILSDDGYLGEMKGRANEKPAERYHPMIVALLRDPRIKGINGGGYAPEANFSLRDLPEEEREALLDEKPELMELPDLYDLYEENHDPELGERVVARLKDDMQSKYDTLRNAPVDLEKGVITVWSYSSVDDYLDVNFSFCHYLEELFDTELPIAMADIINMDRHKLENICQTAKRKLFLPLFKELLPYDHDYKASNSSDGGGEMEAILTDDGKVLLQLPIAQYFHLFWGEDAQNNRQYLENIDDVDDHRTFNLKDSWIFEEPDPLVKAIFDYLDDRESARSGTRSYGTIPHTKVSHELCKLVFQRFKQSANESFTDSNYYQREFNFDATR